MDFEAEFSAVGDAQLEAPVEGDLGGHGQHEVETDAKVGTKGTRLLGVSMCIPSKAGELTDRQGDVGVEEVAQAKGDGEGVGRDNVEVHVRANPVEGEQSTQAVLAADGRDNLAICPAVIAVDRETDLRLGLD